MPISKVAKAMSSALVERWMGNPTPAPELWKGISLEAQKMVSPILACLLGDLAKGEPILAWAFNGQVVQKTTK